MELHEALKLRRFGISIDEADRRAVRLIDRLRVHFDDAEVEGWEALEGTFGLPDPDDEHVVAAAVVGGAGAVVTSNLRHFPLAVLPASLQIIAPAEFTFNTVSVDPIAAMRAVQQVAARRQRVDDPLTTGIVLDRLESTYGMAAAVSLLRDVADRPAR